MKFFDGWSSMQVLYFLLFLGVIFTFLWLLCFRKRLSIGTVAALALSIVCMITGVITVRLFAILETLGNTDGGKISLFGGTFFMPIAFWLGAKATKRDIAMVFDVLTVPFLVAMLCGRMSCLITGCCLGLPIPGMNGLRWPTREAELLFYVVILLYIAPKILRDTTHGEVYPFYMTTYGVFRFIVETFRVSYTTSRLFHISHFWALLSFCIGSCILIELRERKRGC